MLNKNLIAYAVLCLPISAAAQSTLSLDSFQLDVTPALTPDAEASEMRDCLLDTASCESDEFSGGASFTLDDVVNLGVTKRVPVTSQDAPKTAALAVTDRSDPSAPLPTIDLEILFDYDSDNLTPEAMVKLSSLASALTDPKLANSILVFIGHTDAVGSAAYNQRLSLRRAQSVSVFVQNALRLPANRIETVGLGFERLKNVNFPAGAENRRVQLVLIPGA